MDRNELKKYFVKYTSIENHTFQEFLLTLCEEGLDNGEWVMTEKVHGSNFGFITDGINIQCCKRSGLLAEDEDFFGSTTVLRDHRQRILQCFQLAKEKHPAIKTAIIYGEIFGGIYPHKDVPAIPKVKHVQKGVYYSPAVHFYAFDIKLLPVPGYLGVDEAINLFTTCGFMYAEPLQRGPLRELLKFDVETFVSTIPGKLQLPEPQLGHGKTLNYAEGVVLKPAMARYTAKGSRAILKKKHSTFGEYTATQVALAAAKRERKTEAATAAAAAQQQQTGAQPNRPLTEVQRLGAEVARFVTETRLRGIISKEGIPKGNELGKYIAFMAKDVLEDFKKENGVAFDALDKSQQKEVTSAMNKVITNLFKKNWVEITNGEF